MLEGARQMLPRTGLPWLGLLLVSCASPSDPAWQPTGADRAPSARSAAKQPVTRPEPPEIRARLSRTPAPFRLGENDVVARIGGEGVVKSDVYDYFYLFEQPGLLRAMQQLVDERLVRQESERLGVRVDEAILEAAVDKQYGELETRVRVETGGRMNVASYLEEVRNLTVAEYRAHTRRVLQSELLLERLARLTLLHEDRAEARIFAVRDLVEAESFRDEVVAGADFYRLAKENSIHPSAQQGGLLPTIVRGLPDPIVASVFSLQPGEIGEVERIELDGEPMYFFVQLLELIPAKDGDYASLEEELLRSLEKEPVAEHEYLYWRQRAGERYEIELKF